MASVTQTAISYTLTLTGISYWHHTTDEVDTGQKYYWHHTTEVDTGQK